MQSAEQLFVVRRQEEEQEKTKDNWSFTFCFSRFFAPIVYMIQRRRIGFFCLLSSIYCSTGSYSFGRLQFALVIFIFIDFFFFLSLHFFVFQTNCFYLPTIGIFPPFSKNQNRS